MSLDFTNTNLLWTSILAETLYRLGLKNAVICPGSRSAPLAIAFAQHSHIEAIPLLDERSASFFALGLARQQHRPVVLVCTSGTAGANFFPAAIEARESRVPLLILTADRPPELRDCNAGQAIDQHRLYGNYPNWQTELALPSLDPTLLGYLRQTLIHAWNRALSPIPGVVHLNLPFREPLAPLSDAQTQAKMLTFNENEFFEFMQQGREALVTGHGSLASKGQITNDQEQCFPSPPPLAPSPTFPTSYFSVWQATTHGIIIAGPAQPVSVVEYCEAIAHLSNTLGFPVLAEGLSPVRNYADQVPNLISTYDLILRNAALAEKLAPEIVIRIGEMPTSKQLRTWLTKTGSCQWVIDAGDRNLDPLHGKTIHLPYRVETLAAWLPEKSVTVSPYLELWQQAQRKTQERVDQFMQDTNEMFEGKIAWLISQVLPPQTPLFVSSSTPVRDVEFFWRSGNSHIQPYFNRGANGIDGSLSTALGIAHRQAPSIMLTGDLALLHDTNGFLLRQHFTGHLTIVLLNNNGGGIFEMLPIAQFEPPFETFFATPQSIDFVQLSRTYGIEHQLITSWDELAQRLNPLPTSGIRILEIQTDRKADARSRQNNLGLFAADIIPHPYGN